MAPSAEVKHAIHCIFCFTFVLTFEIISGALPLLPQFSFVGTPSEPQSAIESYGIFLSTLLYFLRALSLLIIPQMLFNVCGMLFYNGFREKVQLTCAPMMAPFICFRVVTRGDYPQLVKANVEANMTTVNDVGLNHYIFEVVTDKEIKLPSNQRTREVVVPTSYRTKSGALFKARALQYCLEDDVNVLTDENWIVHLDEETLMTPDSVRGIVNFCARGTDQFGQGLITYASREIVNYVTTFCDSFRVADDLGKLRFQFNMFHKPIFGWKGSYVVTKLGAERKVSFDNGPDGSIAEDCYFSMIAMKDGYSFAWIDGEMHEKSPFTIWDFLQQRKRWLQGIYLTVKSRAIPWTSKLFLAISFFSWATLPLAVTNVIFAKALPLPKFLPFDLTVSFVGGFTLYMYIFGAMKSFAHKYRQKPHRIILYTLGAMLSIPINVTVEVMAVLWGLFGEKHRFYVVDKDYKSKAIKQESLLTLVENIA